MDSNSISNETISNETISNETISNETISNETISNETISNEITNCYKKKNVLIDSINKLIKSNRKNKALLSLKYDNLTNKINFIQVSVIIVSTAITFIETIKSKYEINDIIGTLLPIIFPTYIALVLAIIRFFNLDEKKEEISKTIQNFNFIINKLRKTLNTINLFEISADSIDNWYMICSNYENDTYDFIVLTKESYDNIMPFKHVNYYKKKYRKILLDNKFINNELNVIDKYKNINHTKYDINEHWCLYILKNLFCCSKRKILYDNFLEDMELLDDSDLLNDNSLNDNSLNNNSLNNNLLTSNLLNNNKIVEI